MFANLMKSKANQMESNELGNGAITVEYVVIILVVVALAALLFAFKDVIATWIGKAQTNIESMFNNNYTPVSGN